MAEKYEIPITVSMTGISDASKEMSGFTGKLQSMSLSAKTAGANLQNLAIVFGAGFGIKECALQASQFNKNLYDISRSSSFTGQSLQAMTNQIYNLSSATNLSRQDSMKFFEQVNKMTYGARMSATDIAKLGKTIQDEFGGGIENASAVLQNFMGIQQKSIAIFDAAKKGMSDKEIAAYTVSLRSLHGASEEQVEAFQRVAKASRSGGKELTEQEKKLRASSDAVNKLNKAQSDLKLDVGQKAEKDFTALTNALAGLTNELKGIPSSFIAIATAAAGLGGLVTMFGSLTNMASKFGETMSNLGKGPAADRGALGGGTVLEDLGSFLPGIGGKGKKPTPTRGARGSVAKGGKSPAAGSGGVSGKAAASTPTIGSRISGLTGGSPGMSVAVVDIRGNAIAVLRSLVGGGSGGVAGIADGAADIADAASELKDAAKTTKATGKAGAAARAGGLTGKAGRTARLASWAKPSMAGRAYGAAKNLFSTRLGGGVAGVIGGIAGNLAGNAIGGKAGAGIRAGTNVVSSAVTGAQIGSMLGPIGTVVGGIVGAGAGLISSWDDIKTATGGAFDGLEKWASRLWTSSEEVGKAQEKLRDAYGVAADQMPTFTDKLLNVGKSLVGCGESADQMAERLALAGDAALQFGKDFGDLTKKEKDQLKSDLKEIVELEKAGASRKDPESLLKMAAKKDILTEVALKQGYKKEDVGELQGQVERGAAPASLQLAFANALKDDRRVKEAQKAAADRYGVRAEKTKEGSVAAASSSGLDSANALANAIKAQTDAQKQLNDLHDQMNQGLDLTLSYLSNQSGNEKEIAEIFKQKDQMLSQELQSAKEIAKQNRETSSEVIKQLNNEIALLSSKRMNVAETEHLKVLQTKVLNLTSQQAKAEGEIAKKQMESLAILDKKMHANDSELSMLSAQESMLSAEAEINKELYGGAAADLEIQSKRFDISKKEEALQLKKADMAREDIARNGENFENRKRLFEAETLVSQEKKKQLDLTKHLREGYLDAMSASSNAEGAFSKFVMSRENGMGEMMRRFDAAQNNQVGMLGEEKGATNPISRLVAGKGLELNAAEDKRVARNYQEVSRNAVGSVFGTQPFIPSGTQAAEAVAPGAVQAMIGGAQAGPKAAGYASGGVVDGPAGRDVIPAMLTKGEAVINADATRKNAGVLRAMNENKFAEGMVPHMPFNASGSTAPTPVSDEAVLTAIKAGSAIMESLKSNMEMTRPAGSSAAGENGGSAGNTPSGASSQSPGGSDKMTEVEIRRMQLKDEEEAARLKSQAGGKISVNSDGMTNVEVRQMQLEDAERAERLGGSKEEKSQGDASKGSTQARAATPVQRGNLLGADTSSEQRRAASRESQKKKYFEGASKVGSEGGASMPIFDALGKDLIGVRIVFKDAADEMKQVNRDMKVGFDVDAKDDDQEKATEEVAKNVNELARKADQAMAIEYEQLENMKKMTVGVKDVENKLVVKNNNEPIQRGKDAGIGIGIEPENVVGGGAGSGADGGGFDGLVDGVFGKGMSAWGRGEAKMGMGFAEGGVVDGPAGRDVIPAMLTKGEAVINADATKKNAGVLRAMNENKFADGMVPGAGAASDIGMSAANVVYDVRQKAPSSNSRYDYARQFPLEAYGSRFAYEAKEANAKFQRRAGGIKGAAYATQYDMQQSTIGPRYSGSIYNRDHAADSVVSTPSSMITPKAGPAAPQAKQKTADEERMERVNQRVAEYNRKRDVERGVPDTKSKRPVTGLKGQVDAMSNVVGHAQDVARYRGGELKYQGVNERGGIDFAMPESDAEAKNRRDKQEWKMAEQLLKSNGGISGDIPGSILKKAESIKQRSPSNVAQKNAEMKKSPSGSSMEEALRLQAEAGGGGRIVFQGGKATYLSDAQDEVKRLALEGSMSDRGPDIIKPLSNIGDGEKPEVVAAREKYDAAHKANLGSSLPSVMPNYDQKWLEGEKKRQDMYKDKPKADAAILPAYMSPEEKYQADIQRTGGENLSSTRRGPGMVDRALSTQLEAINSTREAESIRRGQEDLALLQGGGPKRKNDDGEGFHFGGKVLGFSKGSTVPGVGNSDSVPAMLTPGEFVVRAGAAREHAPLLEAINSGPQGQKLHFGGSVLNNVFSPIIPSTAMGMNRGGSVGGSMSNSFNIKGDTRKSILSQVDEALGSIMEYPHGGTGRRIQI